MILGSLGDNLVSSWRGEWFLQTVVKLVIILHLSCICIDVGCCMQCYLTYTQLIIIVEYVEYCYTTILYGEDPWRGMWIPDHLLGLLFQCLNELIDLSSCDAELYTKRLGGFLTHFYPHGRWVLYNFCNAILTGVFEKMTAGLTGSSPAVMIASSFWNWFFVMTPDFLVPLEDAIDEGSLVIALFLKKPR